jgi:hypothetical protein
VRRVRATGGRLLVAEVDLRGGTRTGRAGGCRSRVRWRAAKAMDEDGQTRRRSGTGRRRCSTGRGTASPSIQSVAKGPRGEKEADVYVERTRGCRVRCRVRGEKAGCECQEENVDREEGEGAGQLGLSDDESAGRLTWLSRKGCTSDCAAPAARHASRS